MRNTMEESLGQIGSKVIIATSTVDAPDNFYYFALQAISDCVISFQEDVDGSTNADLTQLTTIGAGTVVFGRFLSITLSSGEMIGYLASLT